MNSPEVRDRAMRMVNEHGGVYASEWAALTPIADKFGCQDQALHARDPFPMGDLIHRSNLDVQYLHAV